MKLKNLLKDNIKETFNYLIWGMVTVAVNTGSFLLFNLLCNEVVANTIAFFISTMFAYFSNTSFVFHKKISADTFIRFWGVRVGTIFVDNGALYCLLLFGVDKLFSKLAVNLLVIALNYLLSKLFIYRRSLK